MSAYVVDTNVAVVANRRSPQAGAECVIASVNALGRAREAMVVLDDEMRILDEYLRQLSLAGQPGAGDLFFKWVWENQAVPERCERVRLTLRHDADDFHEFPNDPELAHFDRSDRKFVAVALASRNRPRVLNAVDSDWWDFRAQLKRHGLRIEFLCPEQFARR